MKRPRILSNAYRLNARSLKEIFWAMATTVSGYAAEGKIRFRGRRLGNEAFINVAVWYLADMDRAEQERVLRTYLPRIEAYLSGPLAADDDDEVPGPVPPEDTYVQGEPVDPPAGPSPAAQSAKRKRSG